MSASTAVLIRELRTLTARDQRDLQSFVDRSSLELMNRYCPIVIGVRESASAERIKDSHRRIMQINHPDKGGSAYMTAKINEAKLILLKGK